MAKKPPKTDLHQNQNGSFIDSNSSQIRRFHGILRISLVQEMQKYQSRRNVTKPRNRSSLERGQKTLWKLKSAFGRRKTALRVIQAVLYGKADFSSKRRSEEVRVETGKCREEAQKKENINDRNTRIYCHWFLVMWKDQIVYVPPPVVFYNLDVLNFT